MLPSNLVFLTIWTDNNNDNRYYRNLSESETETSYFIRVRCVQATKSKYSVFKLMYFLKNMKILIDLIWQEICLHICTYVHNPHFPNKMIV